MKQVVHNADDRAVADPGLLRIIVRAHDFQERLMEDPNLTVPAIASQERLTIGCLSRLLRLPSPAPDIVRAIINGKHPPELSAKRLTRLTPKLPPRTAQVARVSGALTPLLLASGVMLSSRRCWKCCPPNAPREIVESVRSRIRRRIVSTASKEIWGLKLAEFCEDFD